MELFGRSAPIVLDLGCGNGRYLLASAVARPECDHLGVDTLPVVIRYARRRGNQRGVKNLKYAVGGGRELLEHHVSSGSVSEIHCYHPQPYYDRALVHRRLITPEFLAVVHRTLVPGGLFVIQTDNPGYWRYIRQVVPVFFEFQERRGPWPERAAWPVRAGKSSLAQRNCRSFVGPAPPNCASADEAVKLAETLPPPRFDADRRLRRLDEIE